MTNPVDDFLEGFKEQPAVKPWYVARCVGLYGQEYFCVCQSYTARYLTRVGNWGAPFAAATFLSTKEAEAFAVRVLTQVSPTAADE